MTCDLITSEVSSVRFSRITPDFLMHFQFLEDSIAVFSFKRTFNFDSKILIAVNLIKEHIIQLWKILNANIYDLELIKLFTLLCYSIWWWTIPEFFKFKKVTSVYLIIYSEHKKWSHQPKKKTISKISIIENINQIYKSHEITTKKSILIANYETDYKR